MGTIKDIERSIYMILNEKREFQERRKRAKSSGIVKSAPNYYDMKIEALNEKLKKLNKTKKRRLNKNENKEQ